MSLVRHLYRNFRGAAISCLVLLIIAPSNVRAEQGQVQVDRGLKIFRNVFYTGAHSLSQAMDVYAPVKNPGNPLPLIVFIHGGGWKAGDKSAFQGQCQEFARRGFVTASLNYRFPKEAIWPAQAIDCKSAVRWLRAHATEYNIDGSRIAVAGHSAGGHLSAFLAATNGVAKFDRGDNLRFSSNVQAELWFAGVANLISRASTRGYESEQSPHSGESDLVGGPVLQRRNVAMDASPVTWVSKRTAPFYLTAGTADQAVPPSQVTEMKAALDRHGIYAEVHFIPGVGHGGGGKFFDEPHMRLMQQFLARVLQLEELKMDRSAGGAASLPSWSNKQQYQLISISAPNLALGADKIEGNGERRRLLFESVSGAPEQLWYFDPKGDGFYSIHSVTAPQMVMTVSNQANANQTPVELQSERNADTQLWQVRRNNPEDVYFLAPKSALEFVLDNYRGNKTPGHGADIWHYNGGDQHLQWMIRPPK